jgi:hypothetical protein
MRDVAAADVRAIMAFDSGTLEMTAFIVRVDIEQARNEIE